ncbi:MAG: hypothetical protein HQK54_05960 [Oligoflexales bacterium]|nr:hypothetical protein [Oligoflexales bacterium]
MSDGDSKNKDENLRQENRTQVGLDEIRGLITFPDEKERQQPFLVWDVSESGIGICVFSEMHVGEKIILTIGQPYLLVLPCEVSWCERSTDKQDFRAGLKVVGNDKVFASLHNAFHLMVRRKRDRERLATS